LVGKKFLQIFLGWLRQCGELFWKVKSQKVNYQTKFICITQLNRSWKKSLLESDLFPLHFIYSNGFSVKEGKKRCS
jgi:hypothetical protein